MSSFGYRSKFVWTPYDFGTSTSAASNQDFQTTNDVSVAAGTLALQNKGDLLTSSGANVLTRVPAGANESFMIYDSTTANGMRTADDPDQIAVKKVRAKAPLTPILVQGSMLVGSDGFDNPAVYFTSSVNALLARGTGLATWFTDSLVGDFCMRADSRILIGIGSSASASSMTLLPGGQVSIGAAPLYATATKLAFENTVANRKLVLYSSLDNDHNFLGFGVNADMLRAQITGGTSQFAVYSGTGPSSSRRCFVAQGNGTCITDESLQVGPTSTSAPRVTIGSNFEIGRVTTATNWFDNTNINDGAIRPWANLHMGSNFVTTSTLCLNANNQIAIKGAPAYTTDSDIVFNNALKNRKIVLWNVADNDHQYYGLGVNSSVFRLQIGTITDKFAFYTGNGVASSIELLNIRTVNSTGGIVFPQTQNRRAITLYTEVDNDYQTTSIGQIANGDMVLNVGVSTHQFYFTGGTSSTTSSTMLSIDNSAAHAKSIDFTLNGANTYNAGISLYREASHVSEVTSINWSVVPPNSTFRLTRRNNVVTLSFPQLIQNSKSGPAAPILNWRLVLTSAIPAEFRPAAQRILPIVWYVGGSSNTELPGLAVIGTAGDVQFGLYPVDLGLMPGGGGIPYGAYSGTITYSAN